LRAAGQTNAQPIVRPVAHGQSSKSYARWHMWCWRAGGLVKRNCEPKRLLTDRQLRLCQLAYEHELGMTSAARVGTQAASTGIALDLMGSAALSESGAMSLINAAGQAEARRRATIWTKRYPSTT
jgi:hypothetical protein